MSTMASPQLASSPGLDGFQQSWSFEKAMLEVSQKEQQAYSDPPSPDMLSTTSNEDQIRIPVRHTPEDMKNLKDGTTQAGLLDQYMSSEEQLSPTENDSASSAGGDVDVEDFTDDDESDEWLESIFTEFTCKMATAICFIQVGKPKVVEIPIPSLTSSPSLSSDSERMPSHFSIPPRPRTPVRRRPIATNLTNLNVVRPPLPTRLSGANFANISTPAFTVQSYQPTSSPERKLTTPEPVKTYTPSAPAFLSTDPFAKSGPLPLNHSPRTTSTANHSRFRNLSQKIARFAVHGNSSKIDLSESASESHRRKDSVASFQDPTDIRPQTRSVSISVPTVFRAGSRSKMIPRGAAERAPTIEIPPCPEDFDLDFDEPSHHPNRLRRRKSSTFRF